MPHRRPGVWVVPKTTTSTSHTRGGWVSRFASSPLRRNVQTYSYIAVGGEPVRGRGFATFPSVYGHEVAHFPATMRQEDGKVSYSTCNRGRCRRGARPLYGPACGEPMGLSVAIFSQHGIQLDCEGVLDVTITPPVVHWGRKAAGPAQYGRGGAIRAEGKKVRRVAKGKHGLRRGP